MRQTWRWFGDADQVSIDDICQAGAEGIVTALHGIAPGAVWPLDDVVKRQRAVATMKNGRPSGLTWDVVESLPVSEEIKTQTGAWRDHVDAYRDSLRVLATAGIKVICYNFMPVLDWTRTDITHRVPNGAECMRFDIVDFAAFDLYILARPDASSDYSDDVVEQARGRFADMNDNRRAELARTVVYGLPGAMQGYSLDDLRDRLADYDGIDADGLRTRMADFLEQVAPLADELGLRLCCHPDDPPFPLLGLPRIMSTERDYQWLLDAVDLPANGITLCSGSLGARSDNDLPGMMTRLGHRVHFLHLRNVKRDIQGPAGSFIEDEHLAGDTDMVALIDAALAEEARRRADGREDWSIPFRPDHGQSILDDLIRDTHPGYPAIGRLKGLAELRGVIHGLSAVRSAEPG